MQSCHALNTWLKVSSSRLHQNSRWQLYKFNDGCDRFVSASRFETNECTVFSLPLRCSRTLFRRAIIIIYRVWECVHILFMPACIVFVLLFYLFITRSLFIEALPFMCASVLCKTAFRWHKNELSRKLCQNFVNHRCAQQQVEPLSMTSHISCFRNVENTNQNLKIIITSVFSASLCNTTRIKP